jgi:fructose 1,6-bisphosphate aldolase/phosphatase
MRKLTASAIKADVGGYVGHSDVHPEMLAGADSRIREPATTAPQPA